MKTKRFDIVRLVYDCKTNHPILARIIVLSKMHKVIKFVKIQPMVFGIDCCKPFYRLYIPKVRFFKVVDAYEKGGWNR